MKHFLKVIPLPDFFFLTCHIFSFVSDFFFCLKAYQLVWMLLWISILSKTSVAKLRSVIDFHSCFRFKNLFLRKKDGKKAPWRNPRRSSERKRKWKTDWGKTRSVSFSLLCSHVCWQVFRQIRIIVKRRARYLVIENEMLVNKSRSDSQKFLQVVKGSHYLINACLTRYFTPLDLFVILSFFQPRASFPGARRCQWISGRWYLWYIWWTSISWKGTIISHGNLQFISFR